MRESFIFSTRTISKSVDALRFCLINKEITLHVALFLIAWARLTRTEEVCAPKSYGHSSGCKWSSDAGSCNDPLRADLLPSIHFTEFQDFIADYHKPYLTQIANEEQAIVDGCCITMGINVRPLTCMSDMPGDINNGVFPGDGFTQPNGNIDEITELYRHFLINRALRLVTGFKETKVKIVTAQPFIFAVHPVFGYVLAQYSYASILNTGIGAHCGDPTVPYTIKTYDINQPFKNK